MGRTGERGVWGSQSKEETQVGRIRGLGRVAACTILTASMPPSPGMSAIHYSIDISLHSTLCHILPRQSTYLILLKDEITVCPHHRSRQWRLQTTNTPTGLHT